MPSLSAAPGRGLESVWDVEALRDSVAEYLPPAATFALAAVDRARDRDHPRLVRALVRRQRGCGAARRMASAAFDVMMNMAAPREFAETWDDLDLWEPLGATRYKLEIVDGAGGTKKLKYTLDEVIAEEVELPVDPGELGIGMYRMFHQGLWDDPRLCVQRVRLSMCCESIETKEGDYISAMHFRLDSTQYDVSILRVTCDQVYNGEVAFEFCSSSDYEIFHVKYRANHLYEVDVGFCWNSSAARVAIDGVFLSGHSRYIQFDRHEFNAVCVYGEHRSADISSFFGPFTVWTSVAAEGYTVFDNSSDDDDASEEGSVSVSGSEDESRPTDDDGVTVEDSSEEESSEEEEEESSEESSEEEASENEPSSEEEADVMNEYDPSPDVVGRVVTVVDDVGELQRLCSRSAPGAEDCVGWLRHMADMAGETLTIRGHAEVLAAYSFEGRRRLLPFDALRRSGS